MTIRKPQTRASAFFQSALGAAAILTLGGVASRADVTVNLASPSAGAPVRAGEATEFRLSYLSSGKPIRLSETQVMVNGVNWTSRFALRPGEAFYQVPGSDPLVAGTVSIQATLTDQDGLVGDVSESITVVPVFGAMVPTARTLEYITVSGAGFDPSAANNQALFASAIEGEPITAGFDSVDPSRRTGRIQVPSGAVSGDVRLRVNGVESEEALPFTLKVDPVGTEIEITAPPIGEPLEIGGGASVTVSYNVGGLSPNTTTFTAAGNGTDWTPRFTVGPLAATHVLPMGDEELVGGKVLLLTASVRSVDDVEGNTAALYLLIPKLKTVTAKGRTGDLITVEAEGLDLVSENNVLFMTAPFAPEGVMAVPFTSVLHGQGSVVVPPGVTTGPVWLEVNRARAKDSRPFELIPPFPNCGTLKEYPSNPTPQGPLQVTFLADGGSVVYYRRDELGSQPADLDPECPAYPSSESSQDIILQFSPQLPTKRLYETTEGFVSDYGPLPLAIVPDRPQENVAIVWGYYSVFPRIQSTHRISYIDGLTAGASLELDRFPGDSASGSVPYEFAQEAAFMDDKLMFWDTGQLVAVDPVTGEKSLVGGPDTDVGTIAGSCDGFLYMGITTEVSASAYIAQVFKVDPETGVRTAVSLPQADIRILTLSSTCGRDLLVLTQTGSYPDQSLGLAVVDTQTGVWTDKMSVPWNFNQKAPKLVLARSGSLAIWDQHRWSPLPADLLVQQCTPCPAEGGLCGGALPRCTVKKKKIIEPGQEPGEASQAAEELPPATDRTEKPKSKEPCDGMGDPVNPATGAMFLSHTDAAVTGINRAISVTRSYNSISALASLSGPFGRGWEFGLGKYVVAVGNLLRLSTGTRSPIYFEDPDANGTWTAYLPRAEQSKLIAQGGGGYLRVLDNGGTETYDGQGRMIAQTDSFGTATSFSYQGSEVVAITAPGGRALTFTWANGHIATVSSPSGLQASYAYIGDLLSTVTYADGRGLAFFYDASGRGLLTEVKDHTGRLIEKHEYDSEGRALTSERAGGTRKYTFAYDLGAGKTTITDAAGGVVTYSYRAIAGLTKTYLIEGSCVCTGGADYTLWDYDAVTGRVRSVRSSLNDAPTLYEYNPNGDLSQMTDPLGRVTIYEYDAEGRFSSQTMPDTGVWQTSFAGGVQTFTDPLNRSTSVQLNAQGQRASMTDARGKSATVSYTPQGDVASITDPLNHATTFAYDPSGRLVSTTDALNRTTTLTLDSLGRVSRVEKPDGKSIELTYDASGRRTEVKDERGRVTKTTYDAFNRVSAVTDPAGKVTRYSYDLMGRVVALTDAKGQTTRFEYDVSGRLKATRQPDGKETVLQYDEKGRLKERADQAGRLMTYAYDAISRLTEVKMTGTPKFTYTYDVMDRISTMANGTDALSWVYNLAGEVVSEASARNQSLVAYTYDPNGSRSGLSLDGTPFASYGYDDASRLTSITRGPSVFGFGYDTVNRRTALSLPNGVNTTYSYDNLSRLTGIQAVKDLATISSFAYGYDDVGNRTSKAVDDHLENYGYDALDRLTSVSRTGTGANEWRFGYDAVGNRTSAQLGTGDVVSPTFNNRNQMLLQSVGGPLVVEGTVNEESTVSVNGAPARMVAPTRFEATIDAVVGTNAFTVQATDLSGNVKTDDYEVSVSGTAVGYSYDPAGNLTSKTVSGETWTYSWNALNQLMSASRNGEMQASFQYDPLGRRVVKSTPTKVTTYTYDGADILRENVTVGGIPTTSYYVHGPSIDEPLAKETGGVVTYYHADGLGSIVKETSAAGAVTNTLRYDAWGNIEAGAREGFAFTGREWDPETGLYYYRARYYDPRAGRFISEDPIGFGGGVNLYVYVWNGPTNAVDPTGWKAHVLVNLSAGGGVGNLAGEVGTTFVIDPDTGNTSKYSYGGLGVGLGVGVAAGAEVGLADLDNPTDLAGFGLSAGAFIAVGPDGAIVSSSGSSPIVGGNGASGAGVGIAAGAGFGVSGLITYTNYEGTTDFSKLPAVVREALLRAFNRLPKSLQDRLTARCPRR